MSALRDDHGEERRELRWPMRLEITVRTADMCKRAAVLIELSPHGCRLALASPARAGETVRVCVDHFAPMSATVIWSDGAQCGLAFHQPLHIAVVDHLVRLGPAPSV